MMGSPRLRSALVSLFAVACSGPPTGGRPAPPAGWDDGVKPADAVDTNPDPGVVEINLEAGVGSLETKPGAVTPVWTYNGTVPGPLIRARPGDRLVVHFTNNLPEESTIHWHGVRLQSAMDGVPGHTQAPVPPGGSFDYSFTVPDAGLFWYHPHSDSAVQVGDGLYGPLLVEDPTAGGAGAPLGDEVVLVLSDLDIADDGSFLPADGGGDIATLFGREGNVLLVNGKVTPTLLARAGQRQRWRIVNAAKSRYYQLALEGHTFTRIGGDGGLVTAPVVSDRLLVIPGGRADVLVTPNGRPGQVLTVRWVAYDRGFGTAYMRPDQDLFYLRMAVADPVQEDPVPDVLRAIEPLDATGAKARNITLTMAETDGHLVLGIDGVPASMAQPYYAQVGDTDLWTIENTMDWDHPFHLHGFFFQEVDATTGAPVPEWRDTFNVPQQQTRQMIVRYDDRPGMWMFHCHILDHAEAGMMGMLMLQ
jgi:FtsP/CotA-like multicopper oxidase with cupredoxin domain